MVYLLVLSLCAIVTAIVALSVKSPSSLFRTVKPPSGNEYGCILLCWYAHSQPLESTARGYLSAVFQYFQHPSHALQSLLFPLFSHNRKFLRQVRGQSVPTTSSSTCVGTQHSVSFSFYQMHTAGYCPGYTQEELITGLLVHCARLRPFLPMLLSLQVVTSQEVYGRTNDAKHILSTLSITMKNISSCLPTDIGCKRLIPITSPLFHPWKPLMRAAQSSCWVHFPSG
ncbi:hypothetical protein EDD85DRAFT_802661 [Armillaria nabsnona]|nr:hypothetical protein EDD85DRAFT_802661 [Armillaria nabsnona]